MKENIDQAYCLYQTYVQNGSIKSFLEMVNDYESYRKLNIEFPNKQSKNEFKQILNEAWKQFTIGKDVYRVSKYIEQIEEILKETKTINQKAA